MSQSQYEVALTEVTGLSVGQQGTPLHIHPENHYAEWLSNTGQSAQNWLETSGFSGSGLALIPASDGTVAEAHFFCDTDDVFCCGELPKALPEGDFYCTNDDPRLLEKVALGWWLGRYQYTAFKSQPKACSGHLYIDDTTVVENSRHLAQAVYLTRDLINTPAENLMPQHLGQCVESIARQFSAQCQQWVGEDLLDHNYPTIHAVGRASEHPPRLIELTWGDEQAPPVTLIGKGVCFDSGGLDLKPANGMRNMKKDMGGAAHALALAFLIMAQQLPVRLRLLIPAVENAVAGNAFRPGDVITTRQGTTVEIDNTDAEGRLILCDALAHACADKPELMIDFATLTGAARVALGTELPAMFSSDKTIAQAVCDSGENVGDPVWPMPLHQPYRSLLNSDVADLANCATSPFGGAITAALFLQEFVDDDIPWLHFDVMAWNNRKLAGRPTGGEAMGLRAMFEYLKTRFNDA